MLIASSLSILIISPESIKADDEFEGFEELLFLITGLHPYVTAGWYEHTDNGTTQIDGDITFDLYISSTLSTQTKWKDDLQISIYSYNPDFILPVKIENANITTKIEHELLGETVQKINVTLEKVEYNLSEGDILIFTVEIIQSGKPIGNIIEKRYQEKLQVRAQKVADFLNRSGNENLVAIGDVIMQILGTADEFGISAEEFASLGNSFSSSSFVYNSDDYPSSLNLPLTSGEKTLYFHSALYEENSETEGIVSMEEEKPNGSAITWPTRLLSLDPYESELKTEEWLVWFGAWLIYIELNITPPEEEDKELITYYLTGENTLSLDKPVGEEPHTFLLKNPQEWGSINFNRNKIIKNASAELYIHYPKVVILRKININASLYDGDNLIASSNQKVDRTNILEFISRGPDSPTIFTFDDIEDIEIINGHSLKLVLSVSGKPLIYPLRKVKLLCGTESFPSSLIFKFSETDNIKIKNDVEDKVVIPGGSAKYKLDISSIYKENNININIVPEDPDDLDVWTVEYPNSIQIDQNSTKRIEVFVNSTNNNKSAYTTDKIDLFFNVSGKTGFVSKKADVKVSDDAVDYYLDIKLPSDKKIKHGTSGKHVFKITNKNTGFWDDTYELEAVSEHGWKVELESDEVVVENGKDAKIKVKVFVPEDSEICYDILELNIVSRESKNHDKLSNWTARVITIVINPNGFEQIYNYFESVSESIGLHEFLGDYGAAFLIFIILFIIILFLIPLIYFLRRKYVEIICLDRIKEISPDGKAEYEITLRNPSKIKQTYEIKAEKVNSSSKGWEVSVDTENLIVQGKQTKSIDLSVKPTDYVKKDDWTEVKITVIPIGKKRKAELSTVTTIKDATIELKILGTFSWPNYFKKGDRVNTIFRINNIGNVSADNISVILYVNGKEKNKVEDITIPRRGYAEIEIPWIAVKGKNEVNIIVK
jgi:hypothetical protein